MAGSSWLSLDFFFIDQTISQMDRFLNLIHSSVNANQYGSEELLQEYEDENGNKFVPEELVDEYLEAAQDFPQFAFGSFVISWYSFMEQKLLNVSRSLQKEYGPGLDSNECSGKKGIWLARCKLKQYGINIKNGDWQELCEINKLRNQIVHSGYDLMYTLARLSENQKVFRIPNGGNIYLAAEYSNNSRIEFVLHYAFSKNLIYERGGHELQIIPDQNYCRYLIGISKKLFEDLHRQCIEASAQ